MVVGEHEAVGRDHDAGADAALAPVAARPGVDPHHGGADFVGHAITALE